MNPGFLEKIAAFFNPGERAPNRSGSMGQTVTDIDGTVYETVKIGDQIWMAENLKVTKYRNGDPIEHCVDDSHWLRIEHGAWCEYNHDPDVGSVYGKLYNFHAVNDKRGLAPEGWRIPTMGEWWDLVDKAGGADLAGRHLKHKGVEFWNPPNRGATNKYRFSGLPGGCRDYEGFFRNLKDVACFWTSSFPEDDNWAVAYFLWHDSFKCLDNIKELQAGLSVRCLKD